MNTLYRRPDLVNKANYLIGYKSTATKEKYLSILIKQLQSSNKITDKGFEFIISEYSNHDEIKKLSESCQVRVDQLIAVYMKEKIEALNKMDKIKRYIETLDHNEERKVLIYKYVLCYDEDDIYFEMNMSRSTMYRLQKRALEHLVTPEEFEAMEKDK